MLLQWYTWYRKELALQSSVIARCPGEAQRYLESVGKETAYFFNGTTGAVQFIRGPRGNMYWPYIGERDTLYIMDAGGKGIHREPVFDEAFTIVLAFPNEKHYGQFAKEFGLDPLFLAAWTLDDLQDVLPFVEDRVNCQVPTDADVEERFDKIGGIPRVIFATQQFFDYSVEQLDKSLEESSSFDTRLLCSKDRHWHLVPNYVFTLRSKPPFDSKSTFAALASQYVENQLPKHLEAKQIKFLDAFASD